MLCQLCKLLNREEVLQCPVVLTCLIKSLNRHSEAQWYESHTVVRSV